MKFKNKDAFTTNDIKPYLLLKYKIRLEIYLECSGVLHLHKSPRLKYITTVGEKL